MRISVAMTTYSKRFLKEQLDSIFHQTRLPDELVIFDDASPDDTYQMVQELIKNAPEQIEIRVQKNAENVGFVKNFEQAFCACTGDIISPAMLMTSGI